MKKAFAIAVIAVIGILLLLLIPFKTNNDKLVAYFSATGNTRAVAESLAMAIRADIFEITPETLYTSDDLNWRNNKSRSSIEMSNKNSRPAIANIVSDMPKYKYVFIGFPIWWGREPSIIDTFIESYNFAGKIIIPFATSGSTPSTEDAATDIRALAPNANVFVGKRFPNDVSIGELKTWANEQM